MHCADAGFFAAHTYKKLTERTQCEYQLSLTDPRDGIVLQTELDGFQDRLRGFARLFTDTYEHIRFSHFFHSFSF